jgi:hypothetical protein
MSIQKTLTLTVLMILGIAGMAFASQNRLAGMGGYYYVPDVEFDALHVNPALLTRLAGTHLVFNGFADIYSSTKVNDQPFGYHYGSTNNSITTKDNNLDFHGSQIGFLTSSKAFALGILLTPDYASFNRTVITDPNSKTNNRFDVTTNNQSASGALYNGRILLAIPAGDFSLGISAGYNRIESSSLRTVATNSPAVIIKSSNAKANSFANKLDFLIGTTFSDDKSWLLGLTAGYAFYTGTGSPDPYMIFFGSQKNYVTNDTWMLTDALSGSSVMAGLNLENKIGEYSLLRNILTFQWDYSLSSMVKSVAYLQNNTGRSNFGYYNTGSDIVLGWHLSYNRTWERALAFFGLAVSFSNGSKMTSADINTRIPPTGSGQQLKLEYGGTSLNTAINLGGEGSVLKWLVLRGGIQVGLFSYGQITMRATDSWDTVTSKVKDSIILDNQDTVLTFFSSCIFTGGATLRLGPKVNLDLGTSLSLLGLNIVSDQNQRDNTVGQTTGLKNPLDTNVTLDIKANIGLTFLL